jgi:hypothetical protein
MGPQCSICSEIRSGRKLSGSGYTHDDFIFDSDSEDPGGSEFREFQEYTFGLVLPNPILKRFYGGYSFYCNDKIVLVCPACRTYYLFFNSYPGISEYNFTDKIVRCHLIPLSNSEAITELENIIEKARKTKKLYHSRSTFKEIYFCEVKEIEQALQEHLNFLKEGDKI